MPLNNLQMQMSTIAMVQTWEGFVAKAGKIGNAEEVDIGHGFMIQTPTGNRVKSDTPGVWNKYADQWRGIDLRDSTISRQQAGQLLEDYNNHFGKLTDLINKQMTFVLNQDQFDAIFCHHYAHNVYGTIATQLRNCLNQYGSNLIANKEAIKQQWKTLSNAVNNNPKIRDGVFNRRLAEFDLFFSQMQPRSNYRFKADGTTASGKTLYKNNSKAYHDAIAEQEAAGVEPIPNRDLTGLFAEIDLNLKNIEADQTDADWGARSNSSERSDWISLKSYILYLCSRYAPHVLVPFVELIPEYQMDESKLNQVQEDSRQNIDKVVQDVASKYMQSLDTETVKTVKERIQQATEKIPGYNETRYNNQVKAFNKASGTTDLFKLDPFGEDFSSLHGDKTKSGEATYKKKNVGVRIYGQVVLSPSAADDELSKAGAIGFEELSVKQGKQAMGNITIIELKLRDVQGNKFNDINSPWAFLFDARPGTQSGDFLFRYGWALQLPYGDNVMAQRFWNHPGWKVFGANVKPKFKALAEKQQELILCQSLITDSYDKNGAIDVDRIKKEHSQYQPGSTTNSGFMSISLINPSIESSGDGSLLATIQFYCGGLLTKNCPMPLALATKELFANNPKGCVLSDLIVAFNHDQLENGTMQIADPAAKKKKQEEITANEKGQDISSLLLVLGAEDNQQIGENALDPDTINILFSDVLKKRLTDNNSQETLRAWLADVLRANDCTLLSFGSGAGLSTRVPYIIMCTQAEAQPAKKTTLKDTSKDASIDSILANDYDVFSYRHQGSLVEKMDFSQTETPNQYTIAMNFRVGQWLAQSSDNVDENGQEKQQNLSILDRKASLVNLFAQLQEVEIEALAHTWMGLGNTFFVKGQGWNDGKYSCIEVTHTLGNDSKFISIIRAIRIPPTGGNSESDQKVNSTITGANSTTKAEIPTKTETKQPTKKPEKDTNTQGSLNYIIGDSLAILTDQTASKAEVLKGCATQGWNCNQLRTAIEKINKYESVQNLFISIGTNGAFNPNDNVIGLIKLCKEKFPKAKLYAIVGSWGWGNNQAVTQSQVDLYYKKFTTEGVVLLPTQIGKTPAHPTLSNTITQIGKEIDGICDKKPLPETPKQAKISGQEKIIKLHSDAIPLFCIALDMLIKKGLFIEIIQTEYTKPILATDTAESIDYMQLGFAMIIKAKDISGNAVSSLELDKTLMYKVMGNGQFYLDASPTINKNLEIFPQIISQFISPDRLQIGGLGLASQTLDDIKSIYYGVNRDTYIIELRNIRRDLPPPTTIPTDKNPKITGIKYLAVNAYTGVGNENAYGINIIIKSENVYDYTKPGETKQIISDTDIASLFSQGLKFIIYKDNTKLYEEVIEYNAPSLKGIKDGFVFGIYLGKNQANGSICINPISSEANLIKMFIGTREICTVPIKLEPNFSYYA